MATKYNIELSFSSGSIPKTIYNRYLPIEYIQTKNIPI